MSKKSTSSATPHTTEKSSLDQAKWRTAEQTSLDEAEWRLSLPLEKKALERMSHAILDAFRIFRMLSKPAEWRAALADRWDTVLAAAHLVRRWADDPCPKLPENADLPNPETAKKVLTELYEWNQRNLERVETEYAKAVSKLHSAAGAPMKKSEGGRPPTKGKKINQRMLEIFQRDPVNTIKLSAREWAEKLGCAKSTIVDSPCWETIRISRTMEKANSARQQELDNSNDHRRKSKRKGIE